MENFDFHNGLNYTPLHETIFAKKSKKWSMLLSRKVIKSALILFFVSLLIFVSWKVKVPNNQAVLSESTTPTPAAKQSPTDEPSPAKHVFVKYPTAIPTLKPTSTPGPTNTPTPGPTNTPTPGPTNTPTPQPPSSDIIPPQIDDMSGPADGAVVTTHSFCFTMKVSDNISHLPNIWTQYQFDTDAWTDWSNDQSTAYNPCFENVSNGEHSFHVHAKDEAGNVSTTLSRNFRVATISPGGK